MFPWTLPMPSALRNNGPEDRKMGKSKKYIAILAVTAMLLVLCACGAASAQSTPTASQTAETADGETLGDYSVSVTGYTLAKTYEGKDAVVVTYHWTNNSEDTTDFMAAFNTMVYQSGTACGTAIATSDSGYSVDSQTEDVNPGESLDVQMAYLLQDTANPIEVDVFESMSTSNQAVTQTFDLAQ